MNYWRMAMKIGNRGPNQWPDCHVRGIAAIGYDDKKGNPVVEDCRKITEEEFRDIWRKKLPDKKAQQGNLYKVAYQMKVGDTIYVKSGSEISGKGVITKKYAYDPNILDGAKEKWEHYVTVDWKKDFTLFIHPLGAEQTTVLRLEGQRLKELFEKESQVKKYIRTVEAEEGEQRKAERKFRERNRTLIDIKKLNSDYICEVCGMIFEKKYGKIGEKYIIAHHLITIGSRKKSVKTTLDDIALVCSNCHDMLHKKKPPYEIDKLKRMLI